MSQKKGQTRAQWHRENDTGPKTELAVEIENRLMWGLYHDSVQDVTQVEARDRAQELLYWAREYGEYNVSQSSLSRLIRNVDERAMDQGLPESGYGMYHEAFAKALYDDGGAAPLYTLFQSSRHGEKINQMYREAIARFIADMAAIESVANHYDVPPEWAYQDRLDCDPNLGRKHHLTTEPSHEEDCHDPI